MKSSNYHNHIEKKKLKNLNKCIHDLKKNFISTYLLEIWNAANRLILFSVELEKNKQKSRAIKPYIFSCIIFHCVSNLLSSFICVKLDISFIKYNNISLYHLCRKVRKKAWYNRLHLKIIIFSGQCSQSGTSNGKFL